MKSINFEFLRQHWELLASLAGFAEQYLLTDPVSSLVKLRCYAEQLVCYVASFMLTIRPHGEEYPSKSFLLFLYLHGYQDKKPSSQVLLHNLENYPFFL